MQHVLVLQNRGLEPRICVCLRFAEVAAAFGFPWRSLWLHFCVAMHFDLVPVQTG